MPEVVTCKCPCGRQFPARQVGGNPQQYFDPKTCKPRYEKITAKLGPLLIADGWMTVERAEELLIERGEIDSPSLATDTAPSTVLDVVEATERAIRTSGADTDSLRPPTLQGAE